MLCFALFHVSNCDLSLPNITVLSFFYRRSLNALYGDTWTIQEKRFTRLDVSSKYKHLHFTPVIHTRTAQVNEIFIHISWKTTFRLEFIITNFAANTLSPWARVKFSLTWRDKGRPSFSVSWMSVGHGKPGVEFQKCSYITFWPINTKQDWRIFCHISLTYIFKVGSMGQLDNTVFP